MCDVQVFNWRGISPGVEFGHNDLETITRRDGMTLRMRYKHFKSHSVPKKFVWITRRKASLAYTNCFNDTSATQLFKYLKTKKSIIVQGM
jgi:hypothetical protein